MSGKEHPAEITDVNYLDDYSLLGFSLRVEGYDDDAEHNYYFSLDSSERKRLKTEGSWKRGEIVDKLDTLEGKVENGSGVEITVEEDGRDLNRRGMVREIAELLNEY